MGDVQLSGGTPEEWVGWLDRQHASLQAKIRALEEERVRHVERARARLLLQPASFRARVEALLPRLPDEADYGVVSLSRWNEHANEPRENPLDARIAGLCNIYLASGFDQRALIRDLVDQHLSAGLLHFAWRMAVCTLRLKSSEALKLGLTALSIQDRQIDYRDFSRFVCLLYYVARRVGVDPSPLFCDVATLSSSETEKAFLSDAFVPQTPRERLRCLGVQADPKHPISMSEFEQLIRDLGETLTPPTSGTIASCGFGIGEGPNGPTLELRQLGEKQPPNGDAQM